MKIEIKNVKHSEFASEETNCFQATLYIDGKRAGIVRNDGHGGPDYFDGNRDLYDKAEAWLKANETWTLQISSDSEPEEIPKDLEVKVGELLEDHLISKELKNKLRRRILYVTSEKPGVYQLGTKFRPCTDIYEQLANQRPAWKLLNTMDFADALVIWKEQAA